MHIYVSLFWFRCPINEIFEITERDWRKFGGTGGNPYFLSLSLLLSSHRLLSSRSDGLHAVRVPDDHVGVGAHGNPAFAWIKVEDFRSIGRSDSNKLVFVHLPHGLTDRISNFRMYKPLTDKGTILLLTTALSQTNAILSSTPLVPSGIRVKSSLPIAFWEVLYAQWALPTTWRSPLCKYIWTHQCGPKGAGIWINSQLLICTSVRH